MDVWFEQFPAKDTQEFAQLKKEFVEIREKMPAAKVESVGELKALVNNLNSSMQKMDKKIGQQE